MSVIISPNLTRTSDGVDFRTGKKIRKIFHPNGKVEIWEIDGVGNQIKQIQ
jgi:hypothetical protein